MFRNSIELHCYFLWDASNFLKLKIFFEHPILCIKASISEGMSFASVYTIKSLWIDLNILCYWYVSFVFVLSSSVRLRRCRAHVNSLNLIEFVCQSRNGNIRGRTAIHCWRCFLQVNTTALRCEPICGDGLLVGGEACDDGNQDTSCMRTASCRRAKLSSDQLNGLSLNVDFVWWIAKCFGGKDSGDGCSGSCKVALALS